VHRQHAAERQHVVEDGEHRFLDLARVARPGDQDESLRKIERDRHVRFGPMPGGISPKTWRVDDGELGSMHVPLIVDDEQIAGEETVPGAFGDDADRQAELGIRARMTVLDQQFLRSERREEIAVQEVELRLAHRAIDSSPGHVLLGLRVAHDKLVVRGAAGVMAGAADQRTVRRDLALAAAHRLLVQGRGREVPAGRHALEALGLQRSAPRDAGTHRGHRS
jgi:hypothetical protein